MNGEKAPISSSVSLTRNSRLREMTAGTIDGITKKLHEALPELSANDITIMGLIGTCIGGAIASMRRGDLSKTDSMLTAVSATTITASQLTDAFDGSMARLINEEHQRVVNPNGEFVDVASDRIGEIFLGLSRALSADKRNDTPGFFAALSATVTSPLPSMARAYEESRGRAVPETGKGILQMAGTRVGRAFFGIIATEFPQIKGVPVQGIADALSTAANIYTTIGRMRVEKHDTPLLPAHVRTNAEKRLKLLGAVGAGSVIAAGVIYAYHRKK